MNPNNPKAPSNPLTPLPTYTETDTIILTPILYITYSGTDFYKKAAGPFIDTLQTPGSTPQWVPISKCALLAHHRISYGTASNIAPKTTSSQLVEPHSKLGSPMQCVENLLEEAFTGCAPIDLYRFRLTGQEVSTLFPKLRLDVPLRP